MPKDTDTRMVLGIDEAGRGSVIGPLVIAGVMMPKNKLKFLKRMGVKDSKRLTPKKRQITSRKIKKLTQFKTNTLTAQDIDDLRAKEVNLNIIEMNGMDSIIKDMKPELCYIDCIDVSEERFYNIMTRNNPDIEIITEHKADDKYDIVSAASIIAKVERDKQMAIIRKEHPEIGSGYPSDKKTINYLKSLDNNFPSFVRESWNTVEKIKNGEK